MPPSSAWCRFVASHELNFNVGPVSLYRAKVEMISLLGSIPAAPQGSDGAEFLSAQLLALFPQAKAVFMQALPALSAPAYAQLTQAQPGSLSQERSGGQFKGPGNAERGRVALTQYACNACHIIPGVTGPRVYVGRPLDDVGSRKFIAGHLPNTPANLMHWIRDPKQVDPQTAMPDLDVTADDAADISAYLLSER